MAILRLGPAAAAKTAASAAATTTTMPTMTAETHPRPREAEMETTRPLLGTEAAKTAPWFRIRPHFSARPKLAASAVAAILRRSSH